MTKVVAYYSKWAVVDNRQADLSFLAASQKKRLTPTISMALEVAYNCTRNHQENVRSVFCTRYGEYECTFKMLETLINSFFISPASFSMSTHNVPSGVIAINTNNKASSTTISSLGSTLEHGFLEAAMLVRQYLEPVLFIYIDIPLPDTYGAHFKGVEEPIALGILLMPDGENTLSLSWQGKNTFTPPPLGLPSSIRKLHDLLQAPSICGFSLDDGRLNWSWQNK